MNDEKRLITSNNQSEQIMKQILYSCLFKVGLSPSKKICVIC